MELMTDSSSKNANEKPVCPLVSPKLGMLPCMHALT